MIAGETEAILERLYEKQPYDNFLFFGKKKNKKKKPRDGRFWKGLGEKYDKAGGLTGIGTTIDSVVGLFRKKDQRQQPTSFELSMQEPNYQAQDQSKIPMVAYVVGGLLVLGAIAWGFSKMNKRKAAQTLKTV